MRPLSIPTFAQSQQQLLLAEHDAEIASSALSLSSGGTNAGLSFVSPATRRALQAAGHALTGLVLVNCRTGMGGREVGEFGVDSALKSAKGKKVGDMGDNGDAGRDSLPAHGIRVGDVVRVEPIASGARGGVGSKAGKAKVGKDDDKTTKGLEGVVTRVGERSVWIAFDDRGRPGKQDDEGADSLWGQKLWLVKLANDITHRRMEKMTESDHTRFMQVLFGHTTPSSPDWASGSSIDFIDPSLNDSQKAAIRFALASHEIALIHGPPGTGKTHTLIELILQLVRRNLRILVCGPSNISVDNIVERLAPHKIPLVRIGHPARLLSSVLDHSLEVLTQTSDSAAIVKDVRREIEQKQASIRKTRSGRERREIYKDLKELRKEFREREARCVDSLVTGSKVVLATLHGSGGHQLRNQKFDVVLIDEASQALEAQCWVPLLSASKAILAGDHLQLPPTIKSVTTKISSSAAKPKSFEEDHHADLSMSKLSIETLETTLFDRLLSLHGADIKRMLTTQYRMHEKIMSFPSSELYESRLIAADHVKARLLRDLPYEVQDTDDTREPLVFYDTQGDEFPERTEEAELLLADSKSNDLEGAIVARHVGNLIAAGVVEEDIAVITPYNAQVALLAQLLKEKYPGLEIGSVDGFQGREKEAVVVSLVRSNPEREVGFLGEKRRLNVAMTRPRRHLCVCGDSETISRGSPFLKRWMEFLEENADLRYPDATEFMQTS
ncbi:DNA helicase [Uncinocarpus reesii 1704]|uniref:DNA helicase n=1 Tax=Uncinocarpus reesii (strain UAMH 1704) TaxID=336963 RepID=C4JDD8_UNCRE|nr:DNA helicase [Uncinocarpus reesii 1704]EEP75458.1 DNA helicase [Uncinocarpus reesii 1704]